MASTIQSLFPMTPNRAEDFTIYPCAVNFSAPIVAGKYVFSDATTPPQVFGKLLQMQKGIIAGINVTANCSEEDFTKAIDYPLELQILHGGNKTPVNLQPFPFANFSQSESFQLQWIANGTTTQQEEEFEIQVKGEVNQLTGMTSNTLNLTVVFNFICVGLDRLKG